MWLTYAFAAALFGGITSVLAKIGIRNVDSNLATALRTVVVVIFAWVMVFVVGSQNTISSISTTSFVFLVLSGLATGASWLCYFKALQNGDINKVVPIDKSSTLLTMIFAFILFKEEVTIQKIICMVLIAAGTYLMIEKKEVQQEKTSGTWFIYAVLSAVFASLTSVLGKIGVQGVESNLGTAIRTIVVLIMAWAIVFAQGKQKDIKKIDGKSWLFLGFSGLATGLSWLCYYKALQDGPASVVAPIDKLSILVTVFFGYVLFKEKLSKRSGIGLLMMVVGTLALVIWK